MNKICSLQQNKSIHVVSIRVVKCWDPQRFFQNTTSAFSKSRTKGKTLSPLVGPASPPFLWGSLQELQHCIPPFIAVAVSQHLGSGQTHGGILHRLHVFQGDGADLTSLSVWERSERCEVLKAHVNLTLWKKTYEQDSEMFSIPVWSLYIVRWWLKHLFLAFHPGKPSLAKWHSLDLEHKYTMNP